MLKAPNIESTMHNLYKVWRTRTPVHARYYAIVWIKHSIYMHENSQFSFQPIFSFLILFHPPSLSSFAYSIFPPSPLLSSFLPFLLPLFSSFLPFLPPLFSSFLPFLLPLFPSLSKSSLNPPKFFPTCGAEHGNIPHPCPSIWLLKLQWVCQT